MDISGWHLTNGGGAIYINKDDRTVNVFGSSGENVCTIVSPTVEDFQFARDWELAKCIS